MNKRSFTLIEMITVVVVLGILAAIVLMNVQDSKKDSITSMLNSNIRIIQTAVDTYALKHNGEYPVPVQPTLESPQIIPVNDLYPEYIKSKVDFKLVQNQRYWVDTFGKVWGSTVDSPSNFIKGDEYIQWSRSEEAKEYRVYEIDKNKVTSSNANVKKISYMASVKMSPETNRIELLHDDKEYLFSTVDEYGLESAPAGISYFGNQDFFQPIYKKEGVFYFEIDSLDPRIFFRYTSKEDKPEGTSISYQFALKQADGKYGEFVSDFPVNQISKGLKIKVDMKGNNGKYPSLLDLHVYYGSTKEDYYVLPLQPFQPAFQEPDKCDTQPCDFYTLPSQHPSTGGSYYVEAKVDYLSGSANSTSTYPSLGYYCKADGQYYETTSIFYSKCGEQPVLVCMNCSAPPTVWTSNIKPEANPIQEVYKNPTSGSTGGGSIPSDSEQTQENNPPTLTPEQLKGWKTVGSMKFFAHSSDGSRVRWLRAEMTDVKPEHTRIIYTFTGNLGSRWSNELASITDLPAASTVVVTAYLQVESNYPTATPPEVSSVRLTSEDGVVDVGSVKPSVVLSYTKDNNTDRTTVSTASTIAWKYDTYDPRGRTIDQVEWTTNKQDKYTATGLYKVGVRVQNSSGDWSDWSYVTLDVKEEIPVAVVKTNPTTITRNQPVSWSSASFDPDGDSIVNVEWDGDKRDMYTESGTYTVRLRIQDSDGNWSDWKNHIFTLDFTKIDGIAIANGHYVWDKKGYTYMINDLNASTHWYSPQYSLNQKGVSWVGYDFGKSISIKKVRLYLSSTTTHIPSVIIQTSNDQTNWSTVKQWDYSIATKNIWVESNINTGQTGRYWRLLANSNAPNGNCWGVGELEMWE